VRDVNQGCLSSSISYSRLSRTFWDAAAFCRERDHRYLQFALLRILQDFRRGVRELQNAVFTIVASAPRMILMGVSKTRRPAVLAIHVRPNRPANRRTT
jgi:hypothetical protein